MKPYQLLIFDWDGTLMDSVAHICCCIEAAIEELGAEPRTSAEMRQVIGLGLGEAIQALYPQADQAMVQRFSDVYRQRFLADEKTPSQLFPDVETGLQQLSAKGFHMAIATGKSRRGLDKELQQTGLGKYFPVSYCADETFSKPHPKMLEEILTDHNLEARHALMIGDTEYDLAMASNAGMDALAVTWGVHSLERLLDHQPVGHVDNFKQILEWLGINDE